MSTTICYFSATGNTKYVASKFNPDNLISIKEINKGEKEIPSDTDRLGIFYPVYCGSIPYPVEEFISTYLAQRDNSSLGYIFLVSTCGLSQLAAASICDRALQNIGLNISYASSLVAPDGYLPLCSVPDNEKVRKIKEELDKKILKIKEETEREEIKLPHFFPFSRLIAKVAKKANTPKKPNKNLILDESKCIGCSLCVSSCPMDNIYILDNKAHLQDRCISCFACYHICPKNAYNYKKRIGQYKGIEK